MDQNSKKLSIQPISIDKELRASFLDYAMSVIVSRALPDVRDGLKPVHRRILYAMHTLGLYKERAYRKSATVVGEVIGKYHPHGDSAIYQTMVGLVQDFVKRYPLLDGQGNWGSVDGDNAAAMRYTEVRMDEIARDVLQDIEKNTVDFTPNFDESLEEPTVLPSRIPQLLINGSNGIAVGMATSIPPHNLGEIVDACIAVLENPELSERELLAIVPAPDFPGGGVICGLSGAAKAYKTGHGSVRLRGVIDVEETGNRESLIVKEIPYQVNKSALIEKIADLVKSKTIEGISNIRDESSREGIRLVLEIKRGEIAKVVMNQLFKHTQLESTVSIILLAILDNQPVVFTLREILDQFLLHRKEVVTRRTQFELDKAKAREHVLNGIIIAISNIDEAVELIKKSKDYEEASSALQARFSLTPIQAKAILDMRLNRITNLETENLRAEIGELLGKIQFFESLLADESLLKAEIVKELIEIKEKYADKRRSVIDQSEESLTDIDLIPNDDVVITLTQKGYIKRVKMDTYSVQHRGGKGKKGVADLDEHDDVIQDVFVGRNHNTLLFFTNLGRIYSTRVFEIPEGSRIARGRAIVNILPLLPGERIIKLLSTTDLNNKYMVMVTKFGVIKKTTAMAFGKIRSTGIIALDLRDGDELAFCGLSSGNDFVVLASSTGYGTRFSEKEIRPMGRQAAGVRGMRLRAKAVIVGMQVVSEADLESALLFSTSKGYGKQVKISEFRLAHRGGMGVRTIPVDSRNGQVIGMAKITSQSNILLIDQLGKIIRLDPEEIRTMHRSAKGVRLIRLNEDQTLSTLVAFDEEEVESKIDNPSSLEEGEINLSGPKDVANGDGEVLSDLPDVDESDDFADELDEDSGDDMLDSDEDNEA